MHLLRHPRQQSNLGSIVEHESYNIKTFPAAAAAAKGSNDTASVAARGKVCYVHRLFIPVEKESGFFYGAALVQYVTLALLRIAERELSAQKVLPRIDRAAAGTEQAASAVSREKMPPSSCSRQEQKAREQ